MSQSNTYEIVLNSKNRSANRHLRRYNHNIYYINTALDFNVN